MPSSGMRRRVGLVTTDFSEELVASTFRVEKIRELERELAVSSRVNHSAHQLYEKRGQESGLHER
jgi:hypothetical protein